MANPLDRQIELTNYEGEDRVISSVEYKQELEKDGELRSPTFKSGIDSLDRIDAIDGFQEGELITITGPQKNGKTSLAHTFTKNFEDQGLMSLWFSFEVTPSQLFEKFAKAQLFYLPRKLKSRNWDWIVDRVEEAKLKHPEVKAVFIDHLHYVADMEKLSRNSSIEIGTVIRNMKNLARDLQITVFVMAHMTKTRYDELPTESDLRDSSFIAQESDKVLIVWRERKKNKESKQFEFSGKTLVVISNDRRTGAMGKIIPLEFNNGELQDIKSDYDKLVEEAML